MLDCKWIVAAFVGSAVVAGLAASPVLARADDKHGHAHKDGDAEDHGPVTDLGTKKIGGFEVQLGQAGEVKPGEEVVFILKPKGPGEPTAVRAWVGVESGQGSIRTKAEEEKEGEWHAHHKVSKPLPKGSKIWVELETKTGKHKAAFELKK